MSPDVYEVIEEMIEESGKTRATIAAEVGKKYDTFKRELNQHDSGAKLGAELIIPLMKATGSIKVLEYFANFMGYELVSPKSPSQILSEANVYQQLAEIQVRSGHLASVVKSGMDDNKLNASEMRDIFEALVEFEAAAGSMKAGALHGMRQ